MTQNTQIWHVCSPDVFRVINTVSSKSQMLPWVCGTRDIVTAENTGRQHVKIVSGQFINHHYVLNYKITASTVCVYSKDIILQVEK